MSLEEKLAATRAGAAARIPPERQAIMHRATEDLRNSGILDRIVPVGSPHAGLRPRESRRPPRRLRRPAGRRAAGPVLLPRIVVTLLQT